MKYHVEVDGESCAGYGVCIEEAPGAFVMRASDRAESTPASDRLSLDEMINVVRSCPSGAIAVYDENGVAYGDE